MALAPLAFAGRVKFDWALAAARTSMRFRFSITIYRFVTLLSHVLQYSCETRPANGRSRQEKARQPMTAVLNDWCPSNDFRLPRIGEIKRGRLAEPTAPLVRRINADVVETTTDDDALQPQRQPHRRQRTSCRQLRRPYQNRRSEQAERPAAGRPAEHALR